MSYEVCTSYFGFCMKMDEFETLEPAKELFYKLVRESVENKGIPHKYYTLVYMLEWTKNHEHRETVCEWNLYDGPYQRKGYVIDFPRKPKSIFKILKQKRIKRKLKYIHSKCSYCSSTFQMFCRNSPHYCYGPHGDW